MVVTAVVAVTTCDNDDAHLTYEIFVKLTKTTITSSLRRMSRRSRD